MAIKPPSEDAAVPLADAGLHEGLITLDHKASHTGDRLMAEEWCEAFGFRFGPFEFGLSGLGHFGTHTRTETSPKYCAICPSKRAITVAQVA
jgi:hypothetical protein